MQPDPQPDAEEPEVERPLLDLMYNGEDIAEADGAGE